MLSLIAHKKCTPKRRDRPIQGTFYGRNRWVVMAVALQNRYAFISNYDWVAGLGVVA
jgi:hypothetical protein